MSGFRVSFEGAQKLFSVKPDLVTYAKIIGGGLPCGAYGGKKEIMEFLSPLGEVYQAGTMSGNPIVMAAGIATINKIKKNKEEYYEKINYLGKLLEDGIIEIAKEKKIPLTINREGGMFTIFFTNLKEIKKYDDVKTCNEEIFKKYFKHMIKNGINIPPSQYEALFLSVVHTEEHINKFIEAFRSFNI